MDGPTFDPLGTGMPLREPQPFQGGKKDVSLTGWWCCVPRKGFSPGFHVEKKLVSHLPDHLPEPDRSSSRFRAGEWFTARALRGDGNQNPRRFRGSVRMGSVDDWPVATLLPLGFWGKAAVASRRVFDVSGRLVSSSWGVYVAVLWLSLPGPSEPLLRTTPWGTQWGQMDDRTWPSLLCRSGRSRRSDGFTLVPRPYLVLTKLLPSLEGQVAVFGGVFAPCARRAG